MNTFRIFQNFYDDLGKKYLCKKFIPHFNKECNPFLEHQVIVDLIERGHHFHCDYFGLLSWKVEGKLGRSGQHICRNIEHGNPGVDVFYLRMALDFDSVWTQGGAFHGPDFLPLAQDVLDESGIKNVDVHNLKTPIQLCMAGIMRPNLYQDMVETMIKPVMRTCADGPPALRARLQQNAHYGSRVHPTRLIKLFGVPYYPYPVFILERLFPTYVALNGLVAENIPPNVRRVSRPYS